MQGTPYINQGEELGMTNIYFDSIDDYKDIECIDNYRELTESGLISKEDMIRYLGLRGRDNARTPMQWSDSPNAGFTVGTPWIKVNPNYKEINAESQISDKSSVFHYYKKLIQLRKEYDIIIDGHYNLLLPEDERIFAYERILGGQKLLVICNFTQEEAECTLANINEGTVLISNYENHKPHMMQLATCLHMMQGTPYIYQGEELGMTNYPFKTPADFHDIESINAYKEWCESGSLSHEIFWPCLTFISRDNARTPVQWDDSPNAGFTTGTPWMPVNPNYKEINAKAELQDPQSVFYYYKKLIQLRKEYPVIVYGKYQLLLPDDPDLFVYTRELEKEKLLVVCNFSGKEQSIQLPEEFVNGKCLISNLPGQYDQQQVQLKPYEAFVLYR